VYIGFLAIAKEEPNMPADGVRAVVGKALTDPNFRNQLNTNFDAAIQPLKGQLSPDELNTLKKTDWNNVFGSSGQTTMGTWVHIYSGVV
jgi:hypothetical protein